MWVLVVVLMLPTGELTFTRHERRLPSFEACQYALSFIKGRDTIGGWNVSYAACEPVTTGV